MKKGPTESCKLIHHYLLDDKLTVPCLVIAPDQRGEILGVLDDARPPFTLGSWIVTDRGLFVISRDRVVTRGGYFLTRIPNAVEPQLHAIFSGLKVEITSNTACVHPSFSGIISYSIALPEA